MSVQVQGVEKRYVRRDRETLALAAVDLTIEKGDFVAFVGPSGCGKSTLLNMIAGIIEPSAGKILHEAIAGLLARIAGSHQLQPGIGHKAGQHQGEGAPEACNADAQSR